MPRLLFGGGKKKISHPSPSFNLDENGHLKVVNHDYLDFKILREEGYCFLATLTMSSSLLNAEMLTIQNPEDSGFKIYIYDIDMDIYSPNHNINGYFMLNSVESISKPKSLRYHSLLLGDSVNDEIVFNKWRDIRYDEVPFYKKIINVPKNETRTYNYNFTNEMIELQEGSSLLFRNFYYNGGVRKYPEAVLNIKFLKIPSTL